MMMMMPMMMTLMLMMKTSFNENRRLPTSLAPLSVPDHQFNHQIMAIIVIIIIVVVIIVIIVIIDMATNTITIKTLSQSVPL